MNDTPNHEVPRSTSAMAILALVLGIIAIVTWCIGIGVLVGLVSIIVGIIAMVQIAKPDLSMKGKGLAVAGIALGSISILLAPVALAILFPALAAARDEAMKVACMSHLRQVGLVLAIYETEYDGEYPPDLSTAVSAYGDSQYQITECPAAAAARRDSDMTFELWSSEDGDFLYVKPTEVIASPSQLIVVYDRPGNHGDDGINVCFGDGHVEFLDREDAIQRFAEQGIELAWPE